MNALYRILWMIVTDKLYCSTREHVFNRSELKFKGIIR